MVALSGCMRIYPDPELPDIDVLWFEGECELAPIEDVAIALVGFDDPTVRFESTVPCTDHAVKLVDVARVRYQLQASLRDAGAREVATFESEIDVRDGLDKETWLYPQIAPPNVSVSWGFSDPETSCASLAADTVSIRFEPSDLSAPITVTRPCELAQTSDFILPGTYAVKGRALAGGTTVAVGEAFEPVVLDEQTYSGSSVVLVPCAPSCPPATLH